MKHIKKKINEGFFNTRFGKKKQEEEAKVRTNMMRGHMSVYNRTKNIKTADKIFNYAKGKIKNKKDEIVLNAWVLLFIRVDKPDTFQVGKLTGVIEGILLENGYISYNDIHNYLKTETIKEKDYASISRKAYGYLKEKGILDPNIEYLDYIKTFV